MKTLDRCIQVAWIEASVVGFQTKGISDDERIVEQTTNLIGISLKAHVED